MSDQSKKWQEIASQGIATERTLRIRIEQLEAALRDLGDQTAWVIENEDPPVYAVLTDDFDEHFSPDINKALRFSRREDAQAFIDYVGWTSPKPVEHMWVAPRAALAPEQDK